MRDKYDLKDIITFVTISNLKSFTKAADQLNISKSVVTKRINDFEHAVGMTLLARNKKEVNLTTDGKNFLNYCNEILKDVDKLDDFVDSCKEIRGKLRIVLPPYFSRYHIVPYLGEFLQKYSSLKLDITLTENPLNIIEGSYDLQIRIQIPEEENLEVTKLITNRKIVCASPEYIKKHGEPQTPHDLLNHNCLVFGENATWSFEKNGGRSQKIDLKNIDGNIRCDNGEIIKELTLLGLGITLKSACDVANEVKEKKLVVLLKDYEVVNETSFYIVYPSGRGSSPKIKAFIDFFRHKLSSKKI